MFGIDVPDQTRECSKCPKSTFQLWHNAVNLLYVTMIKFFFQKHLLGKIYPGIFLKFIHCKRANGGSSSPGSLDVVLWCLPVGCLCSERMSLVKRGNAECVKIMRLSFSTPAEQCGYSTISSDVVTRPHLC